MTDLARNRKDRTIRFLGTAILTALILTTTGAHSKPTARRPNVLLVSIESLRADHLSGYGYAKQTSPNIDRLGREGTVFTRSYSASSWTIPSHMTMLTSLPSIVHGVDDTGKALDPARITLAEILRSAGYQTAGFVSGPTLHAAFGFSQGFDSYEELSGLAEADYGGDPLHVSPAWVKSQRMVTGPRVRRAVTKWLETKAKPPFFLFVHLWDPHYDYIPPPPYDTMFDPGYRGHFDFSQVETNPLINARMPEREKQHLVALYDGEIAATDAVLEQIVQALERRGFGDNTLIVITSDHGEEFFDHGGKGHFKTLYEEVLHVPLIFHFPGRVKAGQRVDMIFDSIHLMPTILGFLKIDPGPEAEGRDFSRILAGADPPPNLHAFSRLACRQPRPLYSVRTSDRRYIMREIQGNPLKLSVRYYDLVKDPEEKRPVRSLDEPARRIRDEYIREITKLRLMAKTLPKKGSGGASLDERTKRALKALGYIQ
jgi:arylsulfatase A-like enzyme